MPPTFSLEERRLKAEQKAQQKAVEKLQAKLARRELREKARAERNAILLSSGIRKHYANERAREEANQLKIEDRFERLKAQNKAAIKIEPGSLKMTIHIPKPEERKPKPTATSTGYAALQSFRSFPSWDEFEREAHRHVGPSS